MSNRYLNSPALRLNIGRSRLHCILHGLLCVCVALCLWCIARRGYPLLAVSLLPLSGLCCWQLARQRMCGATLCWQSGEWTLLQGNILRRVCVGTRGVCLPWLIFLTWQELPGRQRHRLWLFPDSATAEDLRRLRVRLTLQR